MSPGYGNRIYRNRKSHIPLIVVCLVVISVFVIFVLTGKNSQESNGLASDKANINISSRNIPDSQKRPVVDLAGSPNESAVIEKETAEAVEEPSPNLPESYSEDEEVNHREVVIEANRLFLARKFNQALKLYQSISSQEKSVLVLIGQCYYHLKDYENAYFYLERALEQDKGNFMALKFLAFTAYKTDSLDVGLDYANEALEIKNDPELKKLFNILKREMQVMEGYSDTKSPNFRVIFSKTEHGDIKKLVLDILDEAYRTIGRDMNYYPPESVSVILYNERGFFDVTRAPSWAGGLYDGKIRIPIKGVTGREEMLRRILFHEYTHAYIHSITPRCPRWINEGLAEYYSCNDRSIIGQVIPLNKLEKLFPSSSAKLILTSYKESFSAVSYLIEKWGFLRFRELLEAIARRENLRTAFESVYYVEYSQFLKTWGRE